MPDLWCMSGLRFGLRFNPTTGGTESVNRSSAPRRPGRELDDAGRSKVVTQNINVPACRFYMKQGCVPGAIDRFAYPDFPFKFKSSGIRACDRYPSSED